MTCILLLCVLMGADARSEGSVTTTTCPNDSSLKSTTPDGWQTIAAPRFTSGNQQITAYAADPYDADRFYVTNGTVVMRSTDDGCHFAEVFDLQAQSQNPVGGSSISELEVPASPAAHDRLYVIAFGPSVLTPEIFLSRDAGNTWAASNAGVLPAGEPVELVISESDPNRIYLSLDVVTSSLIFRSDDAGASWATPSDAVTSLTQSFDNSQIVDLEVDPGNPDAVWAASTNGLFGSKDAGATWERADPNASVGAVDVSRVGGKQRIIAFSANNTEAYTSIDGGGRWTRVDTPNEGTVESTTHNATTTFISNAAAQASVYGSTDLLGTVWEPFTWKDIVRPPVQDLQWTWASPSWLYGFSPYALMRHSSTAVPAAPPIPAPFIPVGSVPGKCREDTPQLQIPDVVQRNPELNPANTVVQLAPGESKTVRYQLKLPPRPTLDTYFLVDTTGSMGGAICGVKMGLEEIVQNLVSRRVKVSMGLGDFRDYPIVPFGDPGDWAYRRDRKVGPPDQDLMEALGSLQAGGGGDGPESVLTGIYQSASGAGQHTAGTLDTPFDIPAGQEAGFLSDDVRVILVVSDTDWHEEPGYPGPTWATTLAALNAEHIHVAGISIGAGSVDDMKRMASDTGTLATENVDCDDNGSIDVFKGSPLVCSVESGKEIQLMGPAITDLLEAVQDVKPVSLKERGNSGWVSGIDPDVYPNVDVKADHTLYYDVKFSCPRVKYGLSDSVDFDAHVGDTVVAEATAIVACGTPHHATTPPLAAVPPIPLFPPGLPQVPAPNPGPQPQPRPESQAQQQIQQQSNTVAQAVVVPQKQEQPQMAFVHAADALREQMGSEHAMVRLTHGRSDPLQAAKYGVAVGALSLMLMWGFASVTVRAWATNRTRR